METNTLTYTVLAGNLGNVTPAESETYADMLESALVDAFPDTEVTVTLVPETEGSITQYGVDDDDLEQVEAIADYVFAGGTWLA